MPLSPISSIATRYRIPCQWSGLVAAALVLSISGCASDAAVAPQPTTDLTETFWELTLDHHAVTLSTVAPYDTIRITATPRNGVGEPMDGLPAPTFTSSNLELVLVDSTGLVRALGPGKNIRVVATLESGNLIHADTVFINVTNTPAPPVLASLSIHPVPPDSAKAAVTSQKVLAARAWTADSTAINGLAIYYTSLDPTTATIDRTTGRITGNHPGRVKFTASATAYGVTKADTVSFVIGYMVGAFTYIASQTDANGRAGWAFSPDKMTLGPGGVVLFTNSTGIRADITFDDPANVGPAASYCNAFITYGCGSGNIEGFGGDSTNLLENFRARSFSKPGTYTFHSKVLGISGTIVVVDESKL